MNPHPKPGKKKKKKRGLPPAQRDKVYKEVISRDMVCQNPFCKNGWPLDIPHHIKYKSQGGKDEVKNLILLCIHCHRLVHDGKLKIIGIWPCLEFKEVIL